MLGVADSEHLSLFFQSRIGGQMAAERRARKYGRMGGSAAVAVVVGLNL
jgi:hypothetical protein